MMAVGGVASTVRVIRTGWKRNGVTVSSRRIHRAIRRRRTPWCRAKAERLSPLARHAATTARASSSPQYLDATSRTSIAFGILRTSLLMPCVGHRKDRSPGQWRETWGERTLTHHVVELLLQAVSRSDQGAADCRLPDAPAAPPAPPAAGHLGWLAGSSQCAGAGLRHGPRRTAHAGVSPRLRPRAQSGGVHGPT